MLLSLLPPEARWHRVVETYGRADVANGVDYSWLDDFNRARGKRVNRMTYEQFRGRDSVNVEQV